MILIEIWKVVIEQIYDLIFLRRLSSIFIKRNTIAIPGVIDEAFPQLTIIY